MRAPKSVFYLSPIQIAVIELVAQGKTNPEIAVARGVSEGAIRDMLSRLYAELGVSGSGPTSRFVLVGLACELGLAR